MNIFKYLIICFLFLVNVATAFAESASIDFTIELSEYLQIKTVTSPVLIANITDRTGNLYAPLAGRFRVISNSKETRTLYLKAAVNTEAGEEQAMFEANGRVYIAFANLAKTPNSQSLANCKMGKRPIESPGIVAYPVTSVIGAKNNYLHGKGRYEVFINNGITDISINIGSNVLKSSFASNDPKGFYQATLSLTESDM